MPVKYACHCVSCVSKKADSCAWVIVPGGDIVRSLLRREGAVGEHVRRRADALPVRDDAACWALLFETVEETGRAADDIRRRMVVAAHHDRGLQSPRQVP